MKSTILVNAFCMNVFVLVANLNAQEGRATVRVVDFHTGLPISNVVVDAGFETNIKPGWGWGAGKPNSVIGVTDTNGICVLTGQGDDGSVGIAVTNTAAYYGSSCSIRFTNMAWSVTGQKWQPWNPTVELRLKKVGKRIPLYTKKIGAVTPVRIPDASKSAGFDLLMGDWVKPFGNGKTEDLVFTYTNVPNKTITTRYGNVVIYDCSLCVNVSNDGDGFLPVLVSLRKEKSNLRLPPIAPESGYLPFISKRIYRDEKDLQHHSDIQENMNYFVRVRTKKDENGKIVDALYGKIHGDFQLRHSGALGFIYYLNPTPNDRNLEFDGKNNLFKPDWQDAAWPSEP